MKKRTTFCLFLLFTVSVVSVSAQLKSPLDNAFQSDIENVILDYPNNFQHYTGEMIVNNPQSTDYASLLKIRGAEECTITKYPSQKRNRYSYQAVMLTTEEFEKAKAAFNNYYNRLDKIRFRLANQSYNLAGEYESPTEEKKFTSSVFSVNPSGEEMKNLKIELLMEYGMMEWKVKLLVYEKEREDNERGEIKDN